MFIWEILLYIRWDFNVKVCCVRDGHRDAHTYGKMLANGPRSVDLNNYNENISKLMSLVLLLLPVQATISTKLWKDLVNKKETKPSDIFYYVS